MTFQDRTQGVQAGSARPELVAMWQSVLRKAQQPKDAPMVLPTAVIINFDGGGQALTTGLGGIAEISFPCRLLACRMYGGIVSSSGPLPVLTTATVYLGLSSVGNWVSGARPLYGASPPSMTSIEEEDIDTSDWVTELQPGDLIPYALTAFSGTATFLTVVLVVRRIDVTGIGVTEVDNGVDPVTSGGEIVIFREN